MEKKKVFVIMPFQDQFFEVYEMLKLEFADNFEFSNAAEEDNQQNILKDIVQPIYEADVIIADLTDLNPNVMYELGLAHTFNKKTIMITQDDLSILPFDLKQYRAKDYSTHFKKFAELIKYLETNLKGAVDNTVSFGNPVKDFLEEAGIKKTLWFSDAEVVDFGDDSDKGFIDFLADIEINADRLTKNIKEMTADMQEMSTGISKNAAEIDRVNKIGGSGTASFVRKETKKAAKHLESFSIKLRDHNKNMSDLWDEIEKNTLGLIENPFTSRQENKDGFIKYLKSLYDMKIAGAGSGDSIDGLREKLEEIVGLERSMNQAVKFLDEDLTTYIVFIERLSASIDKILKKAHFVVGDIDYGNVSLKDSHVETNG